MNNSPTSNRFLADRHAAYAFDIVVYQVAGGLMVNLLGLAGTGELWFKESLPRWAAMAAVVVLIRIPFIFKDCFGGRSLGKWAMGIRVWSVRRGTWARWPESALRNIPLLVPVFGELLIWLTLRKPARAFDGVAGTLVKRDR